MRDDLAVSRTDTHLSKLESGDWIVTRKYEVFRDVEHQKERRKYGPYPHCLTIDVQIVKRFPGTTDQAENDIDKETEKFLSRLVSEIKRRDS